jgi:uncharacterized protein (TIGR03437 family)
LASLPTADTLAVSRPNRVVVQPFVANLAPGLYRGSLDLQFDDGRVRSVRIQVIVSGAASVGAAGKGGAPSVEGCTPARLVPAVTSLSPAAPITVGWPVPVTTEVLDDCGNPHESGSVVVSFSNGDPPISLQSLTAGRWAATWPSRGIAEQTVLRVEASNPERGLQGTETVVVSARARQAPPALETAGIVSTAGFQPFVPVAPGSLVTIFGERLSDVTERATGTTLPTRLGSTRVQIGGREVPLSFVSPEQINAVIPIGLVVNTQHQLLVQRANTLARPVQVDVAPAQPAVFTTGTESRGNIFRVRGGGQPVPVAPGNPARAGDILLIFASGLGETTPPVPAGTQAPQAPLSAVSEQTIVDIGGVEAPVESAVLAPGFVGLYQVNARMPGGVAAGNAVPVRITVAGQTSPPVTIAVE